MVIIISYISIEKKNKLSPIKIQIYRKFTNMFITCKYKIKVNVYNVHYIK